MPRIKIKLPKFDMSMETATIAEWLVNSGDTVTIGQEIYSIETDKTTTSVESPMNGVLTIVAEAGGTYEIGDVIAEIDGAI